MTSQYRPNWGKLDLSQLTDEDLIEVWKRDEIPPEVLSRAGIPRYFELTPGGPPETRVWEKPIQQEAIKQSPMDILREAHKKAWEAPGPQFPTTSLGTLPLIKIPTSPEEAYGAAMEAYEKHIAKPITEKLWSGVKKITGWEKEPALELPWGGAEGKAKIGPKGVIHELAYLPFWIIPTGKAGQAGKIGKAGQQFLEQSLKSGTGWADIAKGLIKGGVPEGKVDEVIVEGMKAWNKKLGIKVPPKVTGGKIPEVGLWERTPTELKIMKPLTKDEWGKLTAFEKGEAFRVRLISLSKGQGKVWETIPENIRLELQKAAKSTEELRTGLQETGTIPKVEPSIPGVAPKRFEVIFASKTTGERKSIIVQALDEIKAAPIARAELGLDKTEWIAEKTIIPKVLPEVAPKVGEVPPVKPPIPPKPPTAEIPTPKPGQPSGISSDLREKMKEIIDYARKPRRLQRAEYKAERARRAAAMEEILRTTKNPEEALRKAAAMRAGELPKVPFTPTKGNLTEADIVNVYETIRSHPKFGTYEKERAYDVLKKKFFSAEKITEVPQKNELKLLEDIFNIPLPKSRRAWKIFLEAMNIPRTLITSTLDFSFYLRQGLLTVAGHPILAAKTFVPSLKMFRGQRNYDEIIGAISKQRWFDELLDGGLDMSRLSSQTRGLAEREEPFMSGLIQRLADIPTRWVWRTGGLAGIPKLLGILTKATERAYTGTAYKMRFDLAAQNLTKWERAGVDITDDFIKKWASEVNALTGRGDLAILKGAQPLLNTIFFSPKLQASIIQVPTLLFRGPKQLRLEALRCISAFVAAGLTFVGACMLAGAKVSTDKTSSDFMKPRWGNFRLDPWGGRQQYVVLAFRLLPLIGGERVTTQTGGEKPINRWQTFLSFDKAKLQPVTGFVSDMLDDMKAFGGREIDVTTWRGLGKEARARLVNLFVQDVWEAYEEEGVLAAGAAGVFSFFGGGAMAYPDTLIDKEAMLGQEDEKGEVYRLSTLAGDIIRIGGKEGKFGSPLTMFRYECEEGFDAYEKIPVDKRIKYREQHPELDARLCFWGRITTTRSDRAESILRTLITRYEIPKEAMPWLIKERQIKQVETGAPPSLPKMTIPGMRPPPPLPK